jgi:hypothetical protein
MTAAATIPTRVPVTVADCDRALRLLRLRLRMGGLEERALARIATDDVLDRRLELTRAA